MRRTWALCALVAAVVVVVAAPAHGAQSRCFGAASRDPEQRCVDPKLRLRVVPTPRQAKTAPNAACAVFEVLDGKNVCAFGVPPERATATVALIGDSHAGHWRGALEVVARARGWRGIGLGHASCPLSMAVRDLPEPTRSSCVRWKESVFGWLASHPEVSTVFVSQLSGGTGVVARPGKSRFESAVDGYAEAWAALPPSVQHIVVIRDTPKARGDTDTCIERAMAARRRPGVACAVSRRRALDRDPAAVAAARLRSPRVQTVDLTRVFCDRRVCFPVIGGALVLKDPTHITAVFMATLGPILLRVVDRLTASWT
jgi:hypothetical protein